MSARRNGRGAWRSPGPSVAAISRNFSPRWIGNRPSRFSIEMNVSTCVRSSTLPPQRRAPVIGREAGRQDDAHTAAGADERERTLQKQLVQIGVPVALEAVDAGRSREGRQSGCRRSAGAASAAEHLPRRVAQHGIEAGAWKMAALRVVKDLRELEGPVKEPLALHRTPRGRPAAARRRAAAEHAPRPSTSSRTAANVAPRRRAGPSWNQVAHHKSAAAFQRASGAPSCASDAINRSFARTCSMVSPGSFAIDRRRPMVAPRAAPAASISNSGRSAGRGPRGSRLPCEVG